MKHFWWFSSIHWIIAKLSISTRIVYNASLLYPTYLHDQQHLYFAFLTTWFDDDNNDLYSKNTKNSCYCTGLIFCIAGKNSSDNLCSSNEVKYTCIKILCGYGFRTNMRAQTIGVSRVCLSPSIWRQSEWSTTRVSKCYAGTVHAG